MKTTKKMANYILIFTLLVQTIGSFSQSENNTTLTGKKAKNIILMIGDGMGLAQIYAGYTANKGKLNIEQFKVIGFSKTYSTSDYVTDSGAGATAIATGHKTYNGAIAVDTAGKPLKTIREIAEDEGLSTGLVATCAITHATPASFIAHNTNRNNYEQIAADFLKTDIDVFIGGGRKYFENRSDSVNLIRTLKKNGYTVTDTITDFKDLKAKKLAGFTSWNHNPKMTEGRGDRLGISTMTAIDILNKNKKGFFMMVEGSQIDWGGHDNDITYVVSEMIDFDKTVGRVLDFARNDGNTLVIVTADHETGGLGLTGGNFNTGEVKGSFTSTGHTGIMVPVFAYGPGAENFMGIYNNNEIFGKMLKAYSFKYENTSHK